MKHKWRAYKTSYEYNIQDYGVAMFFVIIKTVQADTHTGFPDIKTDTETINLSQFKHKITRANLLI